MSFRQALQSYVQQIRHHRQAEGEEHLELQELRAYHQGSLPPDEADRVQEHLATCSQCVQLFLGMVNFLEWDLDPHRLSVQDLARSWESFLQRREQQAELRSESD